MERRVDAVWFDDCSVLIHAVSLFQGRGEVDVRLLAQLQRHDEGPDVHRVLPLDVLVSINANRSNLLYRDCDSPLPLRYVCLQVEFVHDDANRSHMFTSFPILFDG